MRPVKYLPIVLALTVSLRAAAPADPVVIAAPGRAPVIVAPAAPEDQVAFAVADLRTYLGRVVGAELAVAAPDAVPPGAFPIRVGGVPGNEALAAGEELGRDGFVLEVGADGIGIAGGSKFGTAYGVYELLERIGVRWLAPGEWGEVVPRLERVTLPAGRFVDRPVFAIRQMHPARVGQEFGDWMRRQRHNRSGFYGHSGLLSPATYGAEHPEWYAEIDGRRQVDKINHFKLCHSNPAMVKQAIADVLVQIRQRQANREPATHNGYVHLNADYWLISISPTDGAGFCQCAACRAMGTESDRLQLFANAVAAGVRQEFPDYSVGYYGAYAGAFQIPAVAAGPGVVVYMTTWIKDKFAPITAPSNASFRALFEGFAGQCPHLALRDFDGMQVWWGHGPIALADVRAVEYRWYRDHGLQGIVTEAHPNWGLWAHHYYLLGKLWWNPDADLDALKRDYVRSAYGEAFEPMWRYHQALDRAVAFPPPEVQYAMRQELEAAARLAVRPDVRRRLDQTRAAYLLLDCFSRQQNGQLTDEELAMALRVAQSVDYHVTLLKPDRFTRDPVLLDRVEPMDEAELRRTLDGVVLAAPPVWRPWIDADDYRLRPHAASPAPAPEAAATSLGARFRYGPHTILIHAQADEPVKVWQEGEVNIQFEWRGPEQSVLRQGSTREAILIDEVAGSTGIYSLVISNGGNRPVIHVANRGAVVKASGALQAVHPFGGAEFYFHVPRGTREFAINSLAEERFTLEVWGPIADAPPVLPLVAQSARQFQAHLVQVPEGTDGAVWRMRVRGEDMKLFLSGIPPFLAASPDRCLALPESDLPR